jgi:hypothetical protein
MYRSRRVRSPVALLTLALVASPWGDRARAGDAPETAEWERPYDGVVPGTPDDAEFFGWTRVVDADTGRPIPGARFVRWSEFVWEGAVERSWPVGTATADATGLAIVDPSEASGSGHWTASAPGYATACDFGARPPDVMALRRGETVALRLLDPLAGPVEGARIEWLHGCSHAPTLRAAVTDAHGFARFEDVDPSEGRLWLATPRGTLDLVDASQVFSIGEAVPSVVLDPGVVPHGIVVDRLGRPVRHALVRSVECGRGPSTLTGLDGRFRLPAIRKGSDLWVRPWDFKSEQVPSLDDRDYRHPQRIALDPWDLVETPWEGAKIRVRARLVGGAKADAETLVDVVREADGARKDVQVRPEGDEAGGDRHGEIDVAPGRYRLLQGQDLGSDFDMDERSVEVAPGAVADVEVALRIRPRLRLRGDLPRDAVVDLVTRAEALPLAGSAEERQVRLSRDVEAAVRVRHLGVTFVLPVGPARDGWREVVVALPPAHRIRWPQGVVPEDVRLLRGRHDQALEEHEGGVETRAVGDLVLEVDLGGDLGTRRLPLRLPSAPAVDPVIDPRQAPRVTAERVSTYRVVAPEGTSPTYSMSSSGGYTGIDVGGVLQGSVGARLEARIPGFVAKRLVVTHIEEREIRWGTASLTLTVVDDEEQAAPARVVLDDQPYDLPEGVLSLGGLDAGPHRLLVAPEGSKGPAKEIRLVLAEGEKRERRVVLDGR